MTTIKHFYNILKENEDIVIFKIGADGCIACVKIEPVIQNSGLEILERNVNDSFELCSFLVFKKIIRTIPVLLCYHLGNTGYVPKYTCNRFNTD